MKLRPPPPASLAPAAHTSSMCRSDQSESSVFFVRISNVSMEGKKNYKFYTSLIPHPTANVDVTSEMTLTPPTLVQINRSIKPQKKKV